MKLLSRALFTLTILVATTFASSAQKVEDIIQKHVAAIGGEAVWKSLKSMHLEGSLKTQGMEITVVQNSVHLKGMRQDITMMGMTGWSIITDKEGWMYMPFGGQTAPEAMTPDMVRQSHDKLDIQGDFIDYSAKGNKIEFLGKDDVEGTEAFKVKITHKDSSVKTVFMDVNTYLILREVDKVKADGKEIEATIDYSNYQKQPSGLVFPMSVNAQQGEVIFTKVELNSKIDDALFKAPSK